MRTFKLAVFWVLTTIVLMFVMVNVHEIGHTIFARAFGDSGAYYTLHSSHFGGPGGGSCWGCNYFNASKLSFSGKLWTSAGGVVATQLVAWLLLALVARWPYGLPAKVLSLGVVLFMSDAAYQTLQGLRANIATQTYLTRVDFADVIWLLHKHWGTSVSGLKVILGAATVCYAVIVCAVLVRVVLQAHGSGDKPTKHGRYVRVAV